MFFVQDGDTALIWACCSNHYKVAKVLLDEGAKVNVASKKVSVLCFNREALLFLNNFMFPILNIKQGGDTALILAAHEGHVEIVKLLLRYESIRINIKSNVSFMILFFLLKPLQRLHQLILCRWDLRL